MELINFVLLGIVSFVSSIIGTIIGSAMLILPPTMIFLGVPVHTAVATARFSMIGIAIGNITKLSLKDKIKVKYILAFAIAGIIGAVFGASFLTRIDDKILKNIIGIFMLIVSVVILFEDFIGLKERRSKITIKHHFLSVFAGIFIGGYMGIIGGGGATVIILLLILIYGVSFQNAVANQKAITLPITIITTLIFICQKPPIICR